MINSSDWLVLFTGNVHSTATRHPPHTPTPPSRGGSWNSRRGWGSGCLKRQVQRNFQIEKQRNSEGGKPLPHPTPHPLLPSTISSDSLGRHIRIELQICRSLPPGGRVYSGDVWWCRHPLSTIRNLATQLIVI